MKAAIYSRYSSDAQKATSIEDQARNCRARAKAEGWEVSHEYADAAISGSDSTRPQYQAMLAAASRREFDVLLIDDLSRFARDSVEQERTIRRLEFQGLRIVATSDGYDSTSKARKIHRQVKGMMNDIFLDDLRDKVHRGLTGQALKGYWCGGKPYGYRLKPVLDESRRDPYGQPAKIGTVLEIDEAQAAIVREIFARYVDGASHRTISKELNARGVPSPGSTWQRKTRRCSGWVDSATRVIVLNVLYTGLVRWNVSQFVLDPDTGKHKRRARPRSEWNEFRDESLRIVSDELHNLALNRTKHPSGASNEIQRAGGKVKFALSGQLVCGDCGAHLVLCDARAYQCGGFRTGACKNNERIRRTLVEKAIMTVTDQDLLEPEVIAHAARRIQRIYADSLASREKRASEMPRELQDIDARLGRLRERLQAGDPDMSADELQIIIERAEAKRRELADNLPEAKESAQILTLFPKAAAEYRKQIKMGFEGMGPNATGKARVALRKFLGKISVKRYGDGSVWAEFDVNPAALLKAAGTVGRGDRI